MDTDLPDKWNPLPDDLLDRARAQVEVALAEDGPDPLSDRLARYYNSDGDYAGTTFVDLWPNPPRDVVAADLHAVRLLMVPLGARATRRLMSGPHHTSVVKALSALEVDDLLVTGAADLTAMQRVYTEVKLALSVPGSRTSDPWVTASKLCARKRPALFPVRDTVVREFLTGEHTSYQVDWLLWRELAGDPSVIGRLDAASAKVKAERGIVCDEMILRRLDVALWTWAAPKTLSRRRRR